MRLSRPLIGLVVAVLLLCAACVSKSVTFTEGTPPHESINAALEANGLEFQLVLVIEQSTTASYRGMTLTSYALAETEVTQADFEGVSGPTGRLYLSAGAGDLYPAYSMDWFEAAGFCNRLSAILGLQPVYDESTWQADFTSDGFYLPTEAQWEYAAGGPDHTVWSLGNEFDPAVYVLDDSQARPVKSHQPNGFGLYDMTGNQAEWCHDWYGEAFPHAGESDPSGPDEGTHRVARGGTWAGAEPIHFACEWRASAATPETTSNYLGFRVAAGGHGAWQ